MLLTAYHVITSTDTKTIQRGTQENPLSSTTRLNFQVNLHICRHKYRSEKVGKALGILTYYSRHIYQKRASPQAFLKELLINFDFLAGILMTYLAKVVFADDSN